MAVCVGVWVDVLVGVGVPSKGRLYPDFDVGDEGCQSTPGQPEAKHSDPVASMISRFWMIQTTMVFLAYAQATHGWWLAQYAWIIAQAGRMAIHYDVLTLFPEALEGIFSIGMVRKAREGRPGEHRDAQSARLRDGSPPHDGRYTLWRGRGAW